MKVDATLLSALSPQPKSEIDSRDAGRQPDGSGSKAFPVVDHTSQGGAVEADTTRGGEVQTEASQRRSLGFEVNPESHEVTIKVVDENGEVIGKVPPEKLQDSMPEINFSEGMKLSFDVDSNDHSVKILLKDRNGEVVRTVPPEYLTQGSIVNVEI
jgi:uncharacterized FlaG/YvyC family protein